MAFPAVLACLTVVMNRSPSPGSICPRIWMTTRPSLAVSTFISDEATGVPQQTANAVASTIAPVSSHPRLPFPVNLVQALDERKEFQGQRQAPLRAFTDTRVVAIQSGGLRAARRQFRELLFERDTIAKESCAKRWQRK